MEISPYLNFNGQCEEAMRFYARVLGGTIDGMMTHRGTPAEAHVPEEWRDRIMHARLVVGRQVIMASDVPPDRYTPPGGLWVSLTPDSLEDAERIFRELSEGGTVQMAFAPTFWSAGFGMCADRYGINWMVSAPHKA